MPCPGELEVIDAIYPTFKSAYFPTPVSTLRATPSSAFPWTAPVPLERRDPYSLPYGYRGVTGHQPDPFTW